MKQLKQQLKKKWKSSVPLEKPEYNFSSNKRNEKEDCLWQSSFFRICMEVRNSRKRLSCMGNPTTKVYEKIFLCLNCNKMFMF